MFATAGNYFVLGFLLLWFFPGCKAEKPAEPPATQEPFVIIKPRRPVLSAEQRAELGFPDDLIAKIELSARAEAEPFLITEFVPSDNLKGEKGYEREKLAGFSVRTQVADELISSYRAGLRARGYLIFKSFRGYGSLPDIVSIAKGSNSYDILKIQRTEAPNYGIGTKTIIAWLKQQQRRRGSFFITGAGPDWVEARFVRPPRNMLGFAKKVRAFAPDVARYGAQTPGSLAKRMKKQNGFYLIWD